VTTGPLLSISINGKGMGEELRLAAGAPLTIAARASLNPDFDRLDRVEIIEQGAVVATQKAAGSGDAVEVEHRATASRGTWFVVRAEGRRAVPGGAVSAVSAPIYVVVDGDARTWKRDAVPGIVERLVKSLDQLQSSSLESPPENEWWEAGPVWQQVWARQIAALGERIEAARSRLRELANRARDQR
jgi:hypothetical protein